GVNPVATVHAEATRRSCHPGCSSKVSLFALMLSPNGTIRQSSGNFVKVIPALADSLRPSYSSHAEREQPCFYRDGLMRPDRPTPINRVRVFRSGFVRRRDQYAGHSEYLMTLAGAEPYHYPRKSRSIRALASRLRWGDSVVVMS